MPARPFWWLGLVALVVLTGCGPARVAGTAPPLPALTAVPTPPVGASAPLAATPAVTAAPGGGAARPPVLATGRMGVARAAHTATLLLDGRVLVTGGCTLDGCERTEESATAEVYDPATGQFTPSGRLTLPRVGHAAIRLPDGRVLLVGGWSGRQETAAAEVYDPATQVFVPAGVMRTPRAGASVTALADGSVLIAGGVRDRQVLASAERYDPRTGRFTPTGPLTEPRTAHAAARLADGRVLLTGGSRAPGAVVASAEVYDPVTGRFTATGAMTVGRHKHAATALGDGTVLIAGGSDERDFRGRHASAERFDPRTGRFTPTASMAEARFKIPDATSLLPSGEVLIGGGAARVELFDPVSGRFRPGGVLDAPRAFSTATLLPGGAVLLVGGYDLR